MSANIEQVVANIRKATKGFGTDEKLLIESILSLTRQDAENLNFYYKANYGRSVTEVIESETSGHFGKLLAQLCIHESHVAAHTLHSAMKGLGCKEADLVETLVGRSNAEIQAIKQSYQELYGKSLEEAIRSETSGDVKKCFTVILQAARDEVGQHNNVEADVEALYKAGEGKFGTDETEFIHLLCNRQEAHLWRVFNVYAHKYGKVMEKVIKSEFSGHIEKLLIAIVRSINVKGEYFAELLESSMAGIGTDEKKLSRLMVRLRGSYIMPFVKEAYLRVHGKTLEKRISGEVSGDYRKLLLAMCAQEPRPYYS